MLSRYIYTRASREVKSTSPIKKTTTKNSMKISKADDFDFHMLRF